MTFHIMNGIRHLAWDSGYGLAMRPLVASGYTVVGASLLAAVLLAAFQLPA